MLGLITPTLYNQSLSYIKKTSNFEDSDFHNFYSGLNPLDLFKSVKADGFGYNVIIIFCTLDLGAPPFQCDSDGRTYFVLYNSTLTRSSLLDN